MTVFVLWLIGALILAGLIGLLWQVWRSYASRSPAETAQEHDLVALNNAQANRVSDHQLTNPPDTDAAWRTMVERGNAPARKRRKR